MKPTDREIQRAVLCECGDACPEVIVTDEAVTIGEFDNTVRLTREEWNILVRKVKAGELTEA